VDALTDPGCRDPAGAFEDPKCDDGLDNDGDGLVDWDGFGSGNPDPQCVDRPWRNGEGPSACGLGLELLLLLPLLSALAARRRLLRVQRHGDPPHRRLVTPDHREVAKAPSGS
jgi:hypothetical protein